MEMAGQRQNIIQAVADYGGRLLGFIRNRVSNDEEAEDILQDVWHQLSSQAKLDDIESISGWLYRVAKNKITDSYRRKKTESIYDEGEETIALQFPDFIANESNDTETAQLRRLFRENLIEALQELPEKQRNVFVWHELEDKTLQEIAAAENENIKTIISRKQYAVKHLRKRLEFLYHEFLND